MRRDRRENVMSSGGGAAAVSSLYVWMCTICVHNQHVSAYITWCLPTLDVIINILLTTGENAVVYNRRDVEGGKKRSRRQLFPFSFSLFLQIATLAAGVRSNAETPHSYPASVRELVIKRHTHTHTEAGVRVLPVSPKHRMLPYQPAGH